MLDSCKLEQLMERLWSFCKLVLFYLFFLQRKEIDIFKKTAQILLKIKYNELY